MAEEEKKEEFRFDDVDDYNRFLDKSPPDGWIKERSLGGTRKSRYLPQTIVEALADVTFKGWHVISESPLAIENGVGFTVKIQALPSYPDSEPIFFTGSAAVIFQENAKNAIEFNFPSARSRAIRQAFSTLGNIFGRNLARDVSDGFTLRDPEPEPEESEGDD